MIWAACLSRSAAWNSPSALITLARPLVFRLGLPGHRALLGPNLADTLPRRRSDASERREGNGNRRLACTNACTRLVQAENAADKR